jgi:hypothetical protein
MARTVNIANKLRKIAASLEELATVIESQAAAKPKKNHFQLEMESQFPRG